MILFETIAVAFGMFSAVPFPQPDWNRRNMRYMLCAFPLVGVLIGGCVWLWAMLCCVHPVPELVKGAGLCLLPVLLTGGIHLDGYADTCDALASCGTAEQKQEILKDPNCGAFAVIRLCSYFVAQFALCTSWDGRQVVCYALSFVLSRSLSGYAVAAFPMAAHTGLARSFADASDKKPVSVVLMVEGAVTIAGMVVSGGVTGLAMAVVAAAVLMHYRRTAVRQFAGISGDLAGWFLQRAELWMLVVLVLAQWIGI